MTRILVTEREPSYDEITIAYGDTQYQAICMLRAMMVEILGTRIPAPETIIELNLKIEKLLGALSHEVQKEKYNY